MLAPGNVDLKLIATGSAAASPNHKGLIMRHIILAAVLVSGIGTAALADEPKYSKAYQACMHAAGGVTLTIWNCLAKESKSWEARISRAYRKVTGKVSPKNRTKIIAAQGAWLRYRKTSCAYYGTATGGTIDIINGNTCWLELTSHRAIEMERLLKNLNEF